MAYTLPAMAQPVDPPGEDDPIYQDPTPIDNWILLLLAGSFIGIYCLIRHRKQNFRNDSIVQQIK